MRMNFSYSETFCAANGSRSSQAMTRKWKEKVGMLVVRSGWSDIGSACGYFDTR